MTRLTRRPFAVLALVLVAAVIEVVLVHLAVRFEVAQTILASGNASPSPLALAFITALMGLRLFVIVVAPGAVLA